MTGLMSPSVIENFVVGIITSVATAFAVWLWGKIRASQALNQKAAFFGIAPKGNCLVVMNHSARDPRVMAHGDVETLVEAVRLIDEIGGKLSIARFDRILEPAGEMAEFCILFLSLINDIRETAVAKHHRVENPECWVVKEERA